jgi:hypothetical protein
LENLDDKEILRLKKEFERIHQHADVGEQIVEEELEDSSAARNSD